MKTANPIQRGVALIAVLWLVAAMGLIITGLVKSVRSEARTVGLQHRATVANALADAAILLVLQNLHALQKEPGSTIQYVSVQFEGQDFEVMVRPLNGLIDINNSSVLLLAEMYLHAGGLSQAAAQSMAQATADLRQSKNAKGATQGFDAIEDLLRVPGMTYELYAKINRLVTADLKGGSGRVNPWAAPAGVLQILTSGDVARATVLAATRRADPKLMDTSSLKPEHIAISSSHGQQLQVEVGMPDGSGFHKMWHIYWGNDPRSALPWRVMSMAQMIQKSTRSGS